MAKVEKKQKVDEFEKLLQERMKDNQNVFADMSEEENDLFGGGQETQLPLELFVPRKLEEYKESLREKGEDVDNVSDFDIFLEDMSTTHARRMNELLGNMTDANFREYYMKMLPFSKSKYKAIDTEYVAPSEMTAITVTVINNHAELNKTIDITHEEEHTEDSKK